MREFASQAGRKVLAVGVLILAAWVLFKVVLGVLTAVAWVVIVVVAILAVIWALRVL